MSSEETQSDGGEVIPKIYIYIYIYIYQNTYLIQALTWAGVGTILHMKLLIQHFLLALWS